MKKMSLEAQNTQAEMLMDWFPLSFAQQRLWFLHQLEPDSAVYNIPGAIRLSGSLRVDVLVRSLNEIMRRHEVNLPRFG